MPFIQILIADDHNLFRKSLRQICEAQSDLAVIGEAQNGKEAIDLALRLQPDVILMDIEMPVVNGIQATDIIVKENPAARVILLTMYQRDNCISDAIEVGASGCLLKDVDEQTLLEAIQAVHRRRELLFDGLGRLSQIAISERAGE